MKKLILTIAVLLLGYATLESSGAFFSTTTQSIQNVLKTGKLNIVLDDDNETSQTTISDTWKATDLYPGSTMPEKVITIKNVGSVPGDHMDVVFSYTGDEELAKNIMFKATPGAGFRFGKSAIDGESINLITGLQGGTDVDYQLKHGITGNALGNIDGNNGTVKDSKISLSELAAAGKIRIERGEETSPFNPGDTAKLWFNTYVDNAATTQDATVTAMMTFTVDQSGSQM